MISDAERYYEFFPEPGTRYRLKMTVRDLADELINGVIERRESRSTSWMEAAIEWVETWLEPLPRSGRWSQIK